MKNAWLAVACGITLGASVWALDVTSARGIDDVPPDRPPSRVVAGSAIEGKLRAQIKRERRTSARLRARLSRERRRTCPILRFRTTIASAYGTGLYGNAMACGGTLHGGSNVVAHRTLPCGTPVHLHSNGRTIKSVVGDRGPYSAGREFDLGPGAWRGLGYTNESSFGVRSIGVAV